MYTSFLAFCFSALAYPQPQRSLYYNDNFDDLDTSSDKIIDGKIGVYHGVDYDYRLRLGRSNVSDSPLQGLHLHSTPNAVYFDGNETDIFAVKWGTIHLRGFSAGCVAHGRPTPCDVYIFGWYWKDQHKKKKLPSITQRIVNFRPQAGVPSSSIIRGELDPWRYNRMKRVKIQTVYKEVRPEEGRTIIDDVVYCWDVYLADCWNRKLDGEAKERLMPSTISA